MVKKLPCKARGVGSSPGWVAKIPHAVEQPSLSGATTEPSRTARESMSP